MCNTLVPNLFKIGRKWRGKFLFSSSYFRIWTGKRNLRWHAIRKKLEPMQSLRWLAVWVQADCYHRVRGPGFIPSIHPSVRTPIHPLTIPWFNHSSIRTHTHAHTFTHTHTYTHTHTKKKNHTHTYIRRPHSCHSYQRVCSTRHRVKKNNTNGVPGNWCPKWTGINVIKWLNYLW